MPSRHGSPYELVHGLAVDRFVFEQEIHQLVELLTMLAQKLAGSFLGLAKESGHLPVDQVLGCFRVPAVLDLGAVAEEHRPARGVPDGAELRRKPVLLDTGVEGLAGASRAGPALVGARDEPPLVRQERVRYLAPSQDDAVARVVE